MTRDIRTTFRTSDGFRQTRRFTTIAGARRYARERMGENFDIGTSYAVGMYGDTTLTVSGATLEELLGPEPEVEPEGKEACPCRRSPNPYADECERCGDTGYCDPLPPPELPPPPVDDDGGIPF